MTCLNCLNSTSGVCYIHQTNQDFGASTFEATCSYTVRTYTKKEVEEEIIRAAKWLCNRKWYQSKTHYLEDLKYWVEYYKQYK